MHALEGLEGVFICADDVLVVGYGDTAEEISNSHHRNCSAFLERCRIKNIRLNHTKVQFKVSDIIYMGHRLTSQGMSSDPSKVTAITHMSPPQNVSTSWISEHRSLFSQVPAPFVGCGRASSSPAKERC